MKLLMCVLLMSGLFGCAIDSANSYEKNAAERAQKESLDEKKSTDIKNIYLETLKKELIDKKVYFNDVKIEYTCLLYTDKILSLKSDGSRTTDKSGFYLKASEYPAKFQELKIADVVIENFPDASFWNEAERSIAPEKNVVSMDVMLKTVDSKGNTYVFSAYTSTFNDIKNLKFDKLINYEKTTSANFKCLYSFEPEKKYNFSKPDWIKIKKGSIWIGMSEAAFVLSLGKPNEIHSSSFRGSSAEQWIVKSHGSSSYYYFSKNKLTGWN